MTSYKLDEMSLSELKSLASRIERAISQLDRRRYAKAKSEARKIAKRYGYTLAELTQSDQSAITRVHPSKFVHSKNPELTWSGVGRMPMWLKLEIKDGKSLEDFLIKPRRVFSDYSSIQPYAYISS